MHSAEGRSGYRVGRGNNPNRPHDKSWHDTEGYSKEEALKKIALLRQKIDTIDEQILILLKKRIEISKKIGEIKHMHGLLIRNSEREVEKYRQITGKASKLRLNLEDVKEIYRKIIDMSIQVQEQCCMK